MLLQYFRTPADLGTQESVCKELGIAIDTIQSESCFYIEAPSGLRASEKEVLRFLLAETFAQKSLATTTFLPANSQILEFGPRLNFETSFSTTAVAILRRCGIESVTRLERFVRVSVPTETSFAAIESLSAALYDRMTETVYETVPTTLTCMAEPKAVSIIPVLEDGRQALEEVNSRFGLGFDDQDIMLCLHIFADTLQRNPTIVELFQLAQANSEHSRHWRFRGELWIDIQLCEQTLMDVVKEPWKRNPGNSVIAFHDNSSAILGTLAPCLVPTIPGHPSPLELHMLKLHPTLTAETHNHPCGVSPYPGALTATGGRIRDNQAIGTGGKVVAGGAGFCTANLCIPGYEQSWEHGSMGAPPGKASPLEIMLEAPRGCWDYGNCFGEPVIYGFTRTFETTNRFEERRAWHKPIVYSVGAGSLDEHHVQKQTPEPGMCVVLIGGPAYRIGVGGGAASSMDSGANTAELDFASVQRGAPEMEQRVDRLIQACIALGSENPIVSIHDLGAGGTCNALPEIVAPTGAVIQLRDIPSGDTTLSTMELWGNESQERNVLLVRPDKVELLHQFAARECVPLATVGTITDDGQFVVHDACDDSQPVNLPLDLILGDLPQKTFRDTRVYGVPRLQDRWPLDLPNGLTIRQALERVLRLPSVCSKRFLTTQVDRSVTGQIVQQQCVGPHHIPLADCAVVADSCLAATGVALSLGERPLVGLISPQAMARMAVAEMLLNLTGAAIRSLEEIRLQANWMLAASHPGEMAWLYDAAIALSQACIDLGIAIEGGKDSMSMAAAFPAENGGTFSVKAPGQLVLASHVRMDNVMAKVTPDLKAPGNLLLHLDVSGDLNACGGSALAQAFGQIGDMCPDVDIRTLKAVFCVVQELVQTRLVRAVHDISDGGLITTLLEMAFAGCVGLDIWLTGEKPAIEKMFSEGAGLVVEVDTLQIPHVYSALDTCGIKATEIGCVGESFGDITISYNGEAMLAEPMLALRALWEETSTAIDMLQANPECVEREAKAFRKLALPPPYEFSFTPSSQADADFAPAVAILREEGSNGDEEMKVAFQQAGFTPWDVTMTDLAEGRITLDEFRGIAFVGGFSFADVCDAGKGWAAVAQFNALIREEFDRFYKRPNTFSLGVCNGCQLMALLGLVPLPGAPVEQRPRFLKNRSGRFESRFPAVKIGPSPAIMLKGMEGSILGVWSAHGEGRCYFPNASVSLAVTEHNLAPIRYVDYQGKPTEVYPFNPNGSPDGIAGLCSMDGRHLAMMPHPERTFQIRQWSWMPESWKDLAVSPWLQLFQNAYEWCASSS